MEDDEHACDRGHSARRASNNLKVTERQRRRPVVERRLIEVAYCACNFPDHSTFSKNRHGRFRQSDLLRKLFEKWWRAA